VTAMAEVEDETKGLLAGGVDYITKPVSAPIVKARVRNHMQLKLHQDHLEELVQSRTRELALTQDVTIHGLASLAETRDNETGRHLLRTQHYVRILALQLKDHPNFRDYLDETTVEMLYKSAPLHDIGKVGVPDAILLKPGRLDEDEFEEMKQHACHGRDAILRAAELMGDHAITSFLRYALEITYTHHERWDGTGYPQGLAGSDIPISGRLMAVADVYDALISRRVYKPPLTHERAVEIMRQSRGSHFDPDALDAFLEIEDRFRGIAMQYADQDEPGDSLC
ncbi:MAG: HD domain-containing protein, partial [Proteobacteria bacterium]|nr:HD domain-containing protein [Pseudomonadota bacterium]